MRRKTGNPLIRLTALACAFSILFSGCEAVEDQRKKVPEVATPEELIEKHNQKREPEKELEQKLVEELAQKRRKIIIEIANAMKEAEKSRVLMLEAQMQADEALKEYYDLLDKANAAQSDANYWANMWTYYNNEYNAYAKANPNRNKDQESYLQALGSSRWNAGTNYDNCNATRDKAKADAETAKKKGDEYQEKVASNKANMENYNAYAVYAKTALMLLETPDDQYSCRYHQIGYHISDAYYTLEAEVSDYKKEDDDTGDEDTASANAGDYITIPTTDPEEREKNPKMKNPFENAKNLSLNEMLNEKIYQKPAVPEPEKDSSSEASPASVSLPESKSGSEESVSVEKFIEQEIRVDNKLEDENIVNLWLFAAANGYVKSNTYLAATNKLATLKWETNNETDIDIAKMIALLLPLEMTAFGEGDIAMKAIMDFYRGTTPEIKQNFPPGSDSDTRGIIKEVFKASGDKLLEKYYPPNLCRNHLISYHMFTEQIINNVGIAEYQKFVKMYGTNPESMNIVEFVRYFKIPKETFEALNRESLKDGTFFPYNTEMIYANDAQAGSYFKLKLKS